METTTLEPKWLGNPLMRLLLAVLFTVFLVLPAAAMAGAPRATPTPTPPVVPASPLTGFQRHQGPALWHALREGDALWLEAEQDSGELAVWWGQFVLGYVPAADAARLQRRLARGEPLQARILRLQDVADPAQRILVRVELSRL